MAKPPPMLPAPKFEKADTALSVKGRHSAPVKADR
jgi:hypothetical protein